MNNPLQLAMETWGIAAAISFLVALLIVAMTKALDLISKKKD